MPSTEHDDFEPDTDMGFGTLTCCSLCGGLCDSVDNYCEGCEGRICTHCDLNPDLFGSSRPHPITEHESKPSLMCSACGEDEALGLVSLAHGDLCPSCASEADGLCLTCNQPLDECRCGMVDPDFDSV